MQRTRENSVEKLLLQGRVQELIKTRTRVTEKNGVTRARVSARPPFKDPESGNLRLIQCAMFTGTVVSISGNVITFRVHSLRSGVKKDAAHETVKPACMSVTVEKRKREDEFKPEKFFGAVISVSMFTCIASEENRLSLKNEQYVRLKKGNDEISWGRNPDIYRR